MVKRIKDSLKINRLYTKMRKAIASLLLRKKNSECLLVGLIVKLANTIHYSVLWVLSITLIIIYNLEEEMKYNGILTHTQLHTRKSMESTMV